MHKHPRALISLIVIALLFFSCEKKKDSSITLYPRKIGITMVRFCDYARQRPLITEIWYPIEENASAVPVSGLWVRCAEARDAPLKLCEKKYPLIVMSHGNGGDRMHNAWLAEILAANGYIVASVDHHGNTWNNKIAEYFLKIWERPQDVSYVIDQLLQNSHFSVHIDQNRIGFIGYSLGGHTGIWMAGGKIVNFDKAVLQSIPKEQLPAGIDDEILDSIDFHLIQQSYKDARIKALFLMAPALGDLFETQSLSSISIPVYIVASEGDSLISIENNIHILTNRIKKAVLRVIPGQGSHYIFLNEASKGGKMILDKKFAIDPPEVDRSLIHKEVGMSAVKFFNKNLK